MKESWVKVKSFMYILMCIRYITSHSYFKTSLNINYLLLHYDKKASTCLEFSPSLMVCHGCWEEWGSTEVHFRWCGTPWLADRQPIKKSFPCFLACSKGPRPKVNLRPVRRGSSLCLWVSHSTNWATAHTKYTSDIKKQNRQFNSGLFLPVVFWPLNEKHRIQHYSHKK